MSYMSKDNILEMKLSELEKKHKEYEIQNDSLDREISDLLDYCKVTEAQLTAYITNPEHFTQDQWSTLQRERKQMDDALEMKLSCIPNIAKKKQAQKDLHVAPHWLFVR